MKKLSVILLFFFSGVFLYAETFQLKLPVASTVDINAENGCWMINCTFNPTKSLPVQLARKIDRKHAENICYAALKKVYKIDAGSIIFSGMQTTKPAQYSGKKVSFSFKIPQKSVKIVKSVRTVKNTNKPVKKSQASIIVKKARDQKADKTEKSIKDENISISTSLMEDDLLDKLEFNVYHIRIKKDLQQALKIYERQFLDLKAAMGWEAVTDMVSLLKTVTDLEYYDVLFNDSRILNSEAVAIYNEIKKYQDQMILDIKINLNDKVLNIEKDLTKFYQEQTALLKQTSDETEKKDIQDTLKQIDEYFKQLKLLKKQGVDV